MLSKALQPFGLAEEDCDIQPFGNGLINNTWIVALGAERFILQKINRNVFKNPPAIGENIKAISDYIRRNHPEFCFPEPVLTAEGKAMVEVEGEYYRLFPFIENSHTYDVVDSEHKAFEAARAFGNFTATLSGFNADQLNITLPHFHNLSLRYDQFLKAIENGNRERLERCGDLVEYLKDQFGLVKIYEEIIQNPSFKCRVTHHDTKISNVLFDEQDKGLCVIDLDTVMPGYFISDVGDMMRTYLSPVSEEEKDFDKIDIRVKYFKAIVEGYCTEMGKVLTPREKGYFVYAGQFMIYMQALRFITDFLNNDVYYGASYPDQNLTRGANQVVLLKKLNAKERELSRLAETIA